MNKNAPDISTEFRRKMIEQIGLWIGLLVIATAFFRHKIDPLTPIILIFFSIGCLCILSAGLLAYLNRLPRVSAALLITGFFIFAMNAGINNGGLRAPVTVAFIILPLIGGYAAGLWGATCGLILSVCGTVSLVFLEKNGMTLPLADPGKLTYFQCLIYIAATLVTHIGSVIYEKVRIQSGLKLVESNHYISNLLDSSPSAVFVTNQDGKIITTNSAAMNLLKATKKDQRDQNSFENLFESNQVGPVQLLMENVWQSGQPSTIEAKIGLQDGEKLWAQLHCKKIKYQNSPSELMLTVNDVTQDKFSLLNKAMSTNVMTLIAKKVDQLQIREQIRKDLEAFDSSYQLSDTTAEAPHRLFLIKQKNLPLSASEEILETTFNQLYELAAQYFASEVELELQRQLTVSTSKMAALGEMSAGVAHEINNPLAIILGKVTVLKRLSEEGHVEPEKLKYDLGKIEDSVARIANIVRSLRTFSLNADKEAMTSVDLLSAMEQVLHFYREKFKFQNIELIINLESLVGLKVHGRLPQIEQVLANLLNNAYDFVQNSQECWVHIECRQLEEFVEISVSDSGPGIPEALRPKLMQPFFTTKEIGKGSGLGLSISKGIVEDHGGKIWYDTSSRHTKFTFLLPLLTQANAKSA